MHYESSKAHSKPKDEDRILTTTYISYVHEREETISIDAREGNGDDIPTKAFSNGQLINMLTSYSHVVVVFSEYLEEFVLN